MNDTVKLMINIK